MNVLITGASGFVGNNLRRALHGHCLMPLDSSTDLTNSNSIKALLQKSMPDIIVHLAGRVGGITDNANNQKEFLESNLLINTNVIKAADEKEIPVISLSSSCCYPMYPQEKYPLKEYHFKFGDFEPTNFAYAVAKGCMMKQIDLSSNKHVCIIPCNLIGKHDHFNSKGAHFVPSIIRKLKLARANGDESIRLLGDGSAMRQFCDVQDLCEIIKYMIDYKSALDSAPKFMNFGPKNNITIKEAAETIRNIFAPEIDITFDDDPKYNGIARKDIDDSNFQAWYCSEQELYLDYFPAYEYTSFAETITELANENITLT